MARTRLGTALRRLREFATAQDAHTAPDGQLLDRFARGRDEAAFAALVRRHGPIVLGVCRRVLGQEQDAEDAFQATFLVLAKKAAGLDWRRPLGGWLYQVAYNMALNARKQAAARRKREARSARPEASDALAEVSGRELLAVFDEELQALPECERQALVLCYLEGKTRDEAARAAGCSESTLKRRLERGKARMRLRLARRGVALSAALLAAGLAGGARAAVPAGLAATAVRAGLLAATGQALAGVVSAEAAALAAGAVRAMAAGRPKAVGALLATVALLGIGAGLLALTPPPVPQREPPQAPPAAAEPRAADDKKEMTVSGRVLDADGKPLPGADVAVMAWLHWSQRRSDDPSLASAAVVLGQGKADAEGRFRLEVPRTSSARFRSVAAAAAGAGHGIGWQYFEPDAESPAAELRLTREHVVRGRFTDAQGQAAAGVAVRVGWVGGLEADSTWVSAPAAGKEPPCWPKATATDKSGYFEVRGVGQDATLSLDVADDRFATQALKITTDGKEAAKEVVTALEPARFIEGTVTYADTGRPVRGALLSVYARKSKTDNPWGVFGRTDNKGRFHINPSPGDYCDVTAHGPDGEPYLTLAKEVEWPKTAVKRQLDLQLPRGVLVRGRLIEDGSTNAVPWASVQFIPREMNNRHYREDVPKGFQGNVFSAEDGTFEICVTPGPGYLLIHSLTRDYVLAEIGARKLREGKEGGLRLYAHAIVPLDLKPGAARQELSVPLKRAVTVKGHVVGPDGQPVHEGLWLSRLHVSYPVESICRGGPFYVEEGQFELHGCDPGKSYAAYFLDAKNRTGATVELSAKQAGEDVTVRLTPCGRATTRLLDAGGKPIANQRLTLEMVITPGPHYLDRKAYDKGRLAADAGSVADIDRLNYKDGPQTDSAGRITFPALIPGATYRIVEVGDRDDMVKCEFKAESGKTIKLPDVVRKR